MKYSVDVVRIRENAIRSTVGHRKNAGIKDHI